MRPAVIYRAYDKAGTLLYVGCTLDLETRLAAHADKSTWHLFHDRIEVEGFDSHQDALDAEAAAIWNEHPRWNIAGRNPEHPDGFTRSKGAAPRLAADLAIWRQHVKVQALRVRAANLQVEMDRECHLLNALMNMRPENKPVAVTA